MVVNPDRAGSPDYATDVRGKAWSFDDGSDLIGINDLDWSFGQHVLVDHVINGVHIQSLYAHMETGSIRVTMGQVLKVGDEVGQVGSTGQSTGAHLHFEIHVNGQPVDPFAWLLANAH